MARKRKRRSAQKPSEEEAEAQAARQREIDTEDASIAADDDGLTPYERQRAALIEMNRQRMAAMGLTSAVAGFNSMLAAQAKPKAPRKKKAPRVRQDPSRHSSRLRGEGAQTDDVSDLALFIINEACPRCGKVQTKMQKQHLEQCTAVRPAEREPDGDAGDEEEEDEEELAEIRASEEAERVQRMDTKLKSLHLDGLVDCDDKAARFVVIGSTKNHYTVTLSDEQQTCQCMDYRLRRHACKHIRLVLTQLDIANNPKDWHKAVEAKLGQALQEEDHAAVDEPLAQRAKRRKAGK